MPKFAALQPIEHDGVRVEPPGVLDLTEEQAAPLLALGHIEPRAGKRPAAAPVADAPLADLLSAAADPALAADPQA